MANRPTRALFDIGALQANYTELSKRVSPAGVMAVVKANAYGHGDVELAAALEGAGCRFFGVAVAEEGARLRRAGIKAPIAVLGGPFGEDAGEFIEFDLTPVVFDSKGARAISRAASRAGLVKGVHLKIETGMGRLGAPPEEAAALARQMESLGGLAIEGVMSHFAEAEAEDPSYTRGQLAKFAGAVEAVRAAGLNPRFVHMANSAAAVLYPESVFDLVRPGIMLYGSYPAERLRKMIALRPVMSLVTRIHSIRKLKPGESVSYGRRFTASRPSVIAVIPIGYADGYPRALSCSGEALVKGRRVKVAGTVCMDLTMLDVTDVQGAAEGDEVVLIGRQGGEEITADELAARAGTIGYELFCRLGQRVARVYS